MSIDVDIDKLWWTFIENGNLAALRTLLEFGFDINTLDEHGRNALQYMAVMDEHTRLHFDIWDMLVEKGIDAEHVCAKGYSLFDYTFLCITYAFVEKLYEVSKPTDLVFKENYDSLKALEAVIKSGLYDPEHPELFDYPFDYSLGDPLKFFNNRRNISHWNRHNYYNYYGDWQCSYARKNRLFWQKVEDLIQKGCPFGPKEFLQSHLSAYSYHGMDSFTFTVEELKCMKKLNPPLNFNQIIYFQRGTYGTLGHMICQQSYGIIANKVDYLIDSGIDLTISDYRGKTILELYMNTIYGGFNAQLRPALEKLLPKVQETFNRQWNDHILTILFTDLQFPIEICEMIVQHVHPPVYSY